MVVAPLFAAATPVVSFDDFEKEEGAFEPCAPVTPDGAVFAFTPIGTEEDFRLGVFVAPAAAAPTVAAVAAGAEV